ncbi:hypothetical protein ACIOYV_11955 [Pseudomonas sp. NPDC087342]|uniref:hypothetical protein n=1 Tax=Pseudomonas sp. NPDC087342 TaxID=3364437 RepID=UPI00381FD74D
MKDPVCFPVSNYDLERKTITRSARRLMKIAGGDMKLSKAREVIAAILGYRDCHDLKQVASTNDSPVLLLGDDRNFAHLLLTRNIQTQLNVAAEPASELVSLLGFYSYGALKTSTMLAEGAELTNVQDERPPLIPVIFGITPTSKVSNAVVTIKRARRVPVR